MRKPFGIFVVLSVAIMLFAACVSGSTQIESAKSDPVSGTEALCKPEAIEDIDFRVLSTHSRPALEENSVAWKMLKLGEDEERIALSAASHFLNALNVPLSSPPQWFSYMLNKAVQEAQERGEPVDYGFFNEAYERFLENPDFAHYRDPEQKLKLFKAVNEGFIQATGDPFAVYVTPKYVKDVTSYTGTYFGIGAGIKTNDNNEWEIAPFGENNPAHNAGIQSHDILRKVDGKSVAGCVTYDLISHVKGRKGTVVNLTVERNGEILEIPVIRGEIKQELVLTWPSVDWPDGRGNSGENLTYKFPLQDRNGEETPGVAYIRLRNFELQPAKDFYYALTQMPWEDLSGLIVDVSSNPGGLINSAVAITGYFLPPNAVILHQRDAGGRVITNSNPSEEAYDARSGITFSPNLVPPDIPVVVLVNKNSYSAAELFSIALQDHGRVTIVGERTGGKGTINRDFLLEGGKYGNLYIAIALWESPSHRFIEPLHKTEEGGILPDDLVEQPVNGFNPDNDENIFRALEILKDQIGK
jgi:carboxyl-terminal processing protease